jgi:hypothetical protein
MSAALPASAACLAGERVSGAFQHAPPTGGRARQGVELVEYLALSLALHAALAFWASRSYPRLMDRALQDEKDEQERAEPFTISVAAVLPSPEAEAAPQVASLVRETPPSPELLERALPPLERTASAPAAPPPADASKGEWPPRESRPRSDEPTLEDENALVAPEGSAEPLPGPEPAASNQQPHEAGTPEGTAAQGPSPEQEQQRPERKEAAASSPSDPQPHEADRGTPQEPELERTGRQRSVLGPGPGEVPIAEPVSAQPPPAGEPPPPREDEARTAESCMQDPELMAQAQVELAEGLRKGLTTVLLAAPEDQLEIARFFGEELVLVPRATLARDAAPRYYRWTSAGSPGVETVASVPPLEGRPQYRDLFDYEYARLPAPLRELRRSVPAREDVYLFAALLSPPEWALVIARRQEALARAGRDLSSVRRLVLRYAREPKGSFDLCVVEIQFSDGARVRPDGTGQGVR